MTPLFRAGMLARSSAGLVSLFILVGCEQSKPAEQTAAETPLVADSVTIPAAAPASKFATPAALPFGMTKDGQDALLYTLTNAHGLRVSITNYGGTVTKVVVPDRDGRPSDVVLGFDNVSDYQSPAYQKAGPYFGALIGRYGNRIRGGQFTLNGQQYTLAKNNDANHLHGGTRGFDKVVWQTEPGTSAEGQTLTLKYLSKDGEEGYPGNLQVKVVYTLTTDDALKIDYTATTDKATPVNLTNHAYFNLGLGRTKDVLAHQLTIPADRYTVVDAGLIPTGELRPVKGTPFDFTAPRAIGVRIGQVPGGYDHNWVLNQSDGMHAAASVYEPTTGRTLDVTTTEPGLQFYTGNFLDGTLKGKEDIVYGKHAGFCLETQHFPDSPNQPKFPSTILEPGQTLRSTTVYRFGVRK
ncbi:galactose mutarotase [Hymenobacter coalescens]